MSAGVQFPAPVSVIWALLFTRWENAALEVFCRAVVVTPSASGHFQWEWPFQPEDESVVDLLLFTDVLVCLDDHYDVDLSRVYTTGFSAGGLWSTYLMMHMSDHLASAAIFSGGTPTEMGEFYQQPSWRIPVLATHGGPSDEVVLRFDLATEDMASRLAEDGHLIVVCAHNEGHVIPWDIPSLIMPFLLSHSWGQADKTYLEENLDDTWPEECSVRSLVD